MITEGVDQFRKVRKNFSKEVAREEKSEKKRGVGGADQQYIEDAGG